jgi:hypothetical protein
MCQVPILSEEVLVHEELIEAVGKVCNAISFGRTSFLSCVQAFRDQRKDGLGRIRLVWGSKYVTWRRAALAAFRVMYFRGDGESRSPFLLLWIVLECICLSYIM